MDRYLATCRRCKRPLVIETDDYDGIYVECPECGTPSTKISFIKITGTYSEDAKCDPSCISAKGHICVCKCAGANHGVAWLGLAPSVTVESIQ